MKIVHLITSLDQGGAEAVLYHLVSKSRTGIEHVVISLMDEGTYGLKIQELGIPVFSLYMPRGRVNFSGLTRLFRLLRKESPDVVQTWMYHADLLGGIIGKLAGCKHVIWGMHHSNLDPDKTNRTTRIVVRLCSAISDYVPAAIASCSECGASVHKSIGYSEDKFAVIPNGYDISLFAPNQEARIRLRKEWGVGDKEWLLGLVARWDPLKDQANLLKALALISSQRPHLKCVLVGSKMNSENKELNALIQKIGVADRLILAGPRNDIPAVMNALDLHVLSSYSEAFPNVVNEAMACGTPCVVTDVGDAALIVGDYGWVVPPNDSPALAEAIGSALKKLENADRKVLSARCRTRIVENFSLEKMIKSYEALWRQTAGM